MFFFDGCWRIVVEAMALPRHGIFKISSLSMFPFVLIFSTFVLVRGALPDRFLSEGTCTFLGWGTTSRSLRCLKVHAPSSNPIGKPQKAR